MRENFKINCKSDESVFWTLNDDLFIPYVIFKPKNIIMKHELFFTFIVLVFASCTGTKIAKYSTGVYSSGAGNIPHIGVSDMWVIDDKLGKIAVPATGKYNITATGRMYFRGTNIGLFRVRKQNNPVAIVSGLVGESNTSGQQFMATVSKIVTLSKGDTLSMEYRSIGSNANLADYGGNADGETGITLVYISK